ncbi:hypothetical protein NQ315_006994 [Exocentrus adspersus]|uniref:Chitin-binding type-4 domain-containing protein n=1 Tax=Exocentrus adspersus TaxID=1586481 RepID=A0AAV8WC73_9CUCU|nr:hypothetical protein NQ315_006994 [Exocentrus adspersus]
MKSCLFLVLAALVAKEVVGHGMMLDPPNRASMWRYNIDRAVPDYQDDQNFCGGLEHYVANGLKCGVCGDPYPDPHPQDNENTGKYGVGVVTKTYQSGSAIDVQIKLTTNHQGTFSYSLCVLPDPNAPEPGEDCFQPLTFADGSSVFKIAQDNYISPFEVVNKIQLPAGLKCDRCVLRWHYRSGNNWGKCDDGTEGMGCGPQETFRSCADIAIV